MSDTYAALEELRQSRFIDLLTFARDHSPFYQELYANTPRQIEDLTQLPVTSKKQLMARFDDWATDREVSLTRAQEFIADRNLIGKNFLGKYRVAMTSGSTGSRGIFIIDKPADAVMESLSRQMMLSWIGADGMRKLSNGRTAMVIATGGHTAANSRITSPEKGTEDRGKKQVFSVHLPIPELVSRLNEYQPALLQGYASTVALLAEEQEAGRLHIDPILVIPTSEGLTDQGYNRIGKAFNAKVGTFYGGTECGVIAWGCEHHWLHLNSGWAVVEPVDANFQTVALGVQSHTVLVSNLANRVQPILRYDLGDSVVMRPEPCPCGNPMPALRVQGRVADIVSFSNQEGREIKITSLQLEMLFDRTPGVQLFQVLQISPTALRVRLRCAEDSDPSLVWAAVDREMDRFLAEQKLDKIRVEHDTEPPEQAQGGKYRQIIPLG